MEMIKITIHRFLPEFGNFLSNIGKVTNTVDEWSRIVNIVDTTNNEQKKLWEQREILMCEITNNANKTQDVEILKQTLSRAKAFRAAVKNWHKNELVATNDLGGEIWLKSFEIITYEQRKKEIEDVIDLLNDKIESSKSKPTPTLVTIWGTDIEKLTKAHDHFKNIGMIKPDLNSWLYWFGGVGNKKEPIGWTYGKAPELLYLLEKICPDFGTKEEHNRKIKEAGIIFDLKIEGYNVKTTKTEKKKHINKSIEGIF